MVLWHLGLRDDGNPHVACWYRPDVLRPPPQRHPGVSMGGRTIAPRNHGYHERRALGGVPVPAFVKRVIHKAWADDCLGKAAQLSYALLFALFPF